MSNASASASSGGIGFFGLLTIVFVILKLTGYIAWTWFWVLSPMIFGLGIAFVFIVVGLLLVAIANR